MTKVFYENKNRGFVLYVDNYELCPVSISFDLNLSNQAFSEGDKKIFIILSKSEKFKIGELTAVNNGQTKFDYTHKSIFDDVTQRRYDTSFVYDLPFQKSKSYKISQGYNGIFSHQNENALDFNMPEGTVITAARDGLLFKSYRIIRYHVPGKNAGNILIKFLSCTLMGLSDVIRISGIMALYVK